MKALVVGLKPAVSRRRKNPFRVAGFETLRPEGILEQISWGQGTCPRGLRLRLKEDMFENVRFCNRHVICLLIGALVIE